MGNLILCINVLKQKNEALKEENECIKQENEALKEENEALKEESEVLRYELAEIESILNSTIFKLFGKTLHRLTQEHIASNELTLDEIEVFRSNPSMITGMISKQIQNRDCMQYSLRVNYDAEEKAKAERLAKYEAERLALLEDERLAKEKSKAENKENQTHETNNLFDDGDY